MKKGSKAKSTGSTSTSSDTGVAASTSMNHSSRVMNTTNAIKGTKKPATSYFCYLLLSQSARHKGHTYIGFTTHPLRRLRQHNGLILNGAYKTSKKRPWSIVCVLHGFLSKISALQFEWAWTNPQKSKIVRHIFTESRITTGLKGKLAILYAMLAMDPWKNMPLHLRYLNEEHFELDEYIRNQSHRDVQREKRQLSKKLKKSDFVLPHEETSKIDKKDIFAIPEHVTVTCGPLEELEVYSWKKSRKIRKVSDSTLPKSALNMRTLIDLEEDEFPTRSDEDTDVIDDVSATEDDISTNDEKEDDDDDDWDEWNNDPLERFQGNYGNVRNPPTNVDSMSNETPKCCFCNNSRSLTDRSKQILTGCPNCDCRGHFSCFTEKLMLQNSVATSASRFPTDGKSTTRMFSTIPSNARLLPSLSTSLSCPKCSTSLKLPQLLETSRRIHSHQIQGNNTFYLNADWSMHNLLRKYVGRSTELDSNPKDSTERPEKPIVNKRLKVVK